MVKGGSIGGGRWLNRPILRLYVFPFFFKFQYQPVLCTIIMIQALQTSQLTQTKNALKKSG